MPSSPSTPIRRAALMLPLLAVLDLLGSPVLYLLPKTVLPILHPALTWSALWAHLVFRVPGATGGILALQWCRSAMWLVSRHPWPNYAITQVPFAVLVLRTVAWPLASPSAAPAARVPTHGSSRWRRPAEYHQTLASVSCTAPGTAGVVVGATARRAWVTRAEVGNPHVLLIGATRAGKSRRVILPTVWCLGHRGESMLLTDPKGELHAACASWLRSRGYEVVLLDLLRPGRGNRWNPLTAVRRAHEAGDAEEAARLAWDMGNTLAFGEQGLGTDPIWPQAAESTIAALALAAALEAPVGRRHPATMYRILADLGGDGEGGAALDRWFRELPPGHPARAAYGTAALSESRTRSSIFTGAAANLRTFADPGVAWLTAQSDHDPAEAGRRPMAIFLLLPDESAARRPIATLYVAQAYGALASLARESGGRLPRPVWFLLDEFGNVGKLPGIAEKLTVSAGRGIGFLLAVQSLAQIDHVYGPRVREIVTGNCDSWLFLRAADEATARAISAKAGTYTVLTRSLSLRPGLVPGSVSGTEAGAARALLTPDEVLRWPLGLSLLLQSGQFPAQQPLCDLSRWRAAAALLRPGAPPPAVPVAPPPTWAPEAPPSDDNAPKSELIPAPPRRVPRQSAFGR